MPAAIDVARYFLSLVDEDSGDSISNLKLQKLLYYAQGFHLAAFGDPLFPESVEAWAHGPVVPNVYHVCKQFGSGPVSLPGELVLEEFSRAQIDLMNEVYSVYGQFSASALRNMTHEELPWKTTEQGEVISHDAMSRFFKTRLVP